MVGLGIVLLYFVRLYHLTTLPVFADEAIYIRWSQVMSAEPTLRFLPLSDGKQPLYMWILMFYVKRVSDPLFAGRILSVFSGLWTMAGIFGLSFLMFKNKLVSIIAALIWAISPFSFFFDRMALVDALLATFSVWTLFFGVLTAKTKRLDFAMITGFTLGGALLTKSPALFISLLIPAAWILSDFPKGGKKFFLYLVKLAILLIPTYLIGYGLYNILRLGPNFNLITSRNADYVFPISHLWINPKDPFIFHIKEIFRDWFIRMGPWPVLVLAMLGIISAFKKYWKELLFLFAAFAFPIFVESMYAKVFTVRYILYTLPPFFILSVLGLLHKKKIFVVLTALFLVFFIGTSLFFDYQLVINPEKANLPSSERSGYLEEWTAGIGIKEVANRIKAEHSKNPSEKILVGTEGYFGTLPDGLQMYLNDIPNVTVIGTGLNFNDVPQSLKDSYMSGAKTYLVVNSSRLKIKPEDFAAKGLKVIATFKKAARREKLTHEYLWYGPYDTFYFFELIKPAIPQR